MSSFPYALTGNDKTLVTVVNESVGHVLGRAATDNKTYSEILTFILETVIGTAPYLLVTQEGIERYRSRIFLDATIRDFVFTIYSTFRARFSTLEEDWESLLNLISSSVSVKIGEAENDIIPEEVRSRLFDQQEVKVILESNAWLVVICLLLLYWNSASIVSQHKAATK